MPSHKPHRSKKSKGSKKPKKSTSSTNSSNASTPVYDSAAESLDLSIELISPSDSMMNNKDLVEISQSHSSSTTGLNSTVITPQSTALVSNDPSSTKKNTTTTSSSDSDVVNVDKNDVASILLTKNSPQSDADRLLQPKEPSQADSNLKFSKASITTPATNKSENGIKPISSASNLDSHSQGFSRKDSVYPQQSNKDPISKTVKPSEVNTISPGRPLIAQPGSPRLDILHPAPSSPRARSAASAIHRILTPETPVISRSMSPCTSAMASRSSSPIPSISKISSNTPNPPYLNESPSAKVSVSQVYNSSGTTAPALSSQFSRMYYNANGSNPSIATASLHPSQNYPHLPATSVAEISNSHGDNSTTILSPSSSSFVLASMDMSNEISDNGGIAPRNRTGPSLHSGKMVDMNKTEIPNLSLTGSQTSKPLEASTFKRSSASAHSRRNLSIQDLTRLVATENLENAGLTSDLLLESSRSLNQPDSAPSSAPVSFSSSLSGNTNANSLSAHASATNITHQKSQQIGQPNFNHSEAASINFSNSHVHNYSTSGRRLPSRKSLTALAKAQNDAYDEEGKRRSELHSLHNGKKSRSNLRLGKAASAINLYNGLKHGSFGTWHPQSRLRSASISAAIGNDGLNSTRHPGRRKQLSIDVSGIKSPSDPKSSQEPLLSPLLTRTGSKVWEESRESKGLSWLAGDFTTNEKTFMVSDENSNRFFRGRKQNVFGSMYDSQDGNNKKEEEEEYNPLTYISRTMIGVTIDDRDSDTQSEADLVGDYEIIEESEEEYEAEEVKPFTKKAPSMKKKASFKLGSAIDSQDRPTLEGEESALSDLEDLPNFTKQDRGAPAADQHSDQYLSGSHQSSNNSERSNIQERPNTNNQAAKQHEYSDDYLRDEENEVSSSYYDDNGNESDEDDYLFADDDFERDLIEPSHNLFIDIVDWVLGLGHESVPFTVPKSTTNNSPKIGDTVDVKGTDSKDDNPATNATEAPGNSNETLNNDTKQNSEMEKHDLPNSTVSKRQRLDEEQRKRNREQSKVARARRQAKRDLEQGLNMDVVLALGCVSYFW